MEKGGEMFVRIKRELCGIGLVVAVALLRTLVVLAADSSLEQRISYNSQDQQGYYLSGTTGLTNETDLILSVAHSRTPLGSALGTETYWFESVGASHRLNDVTLDAAIQFSQTPLTEISSYGGAVGVAMTWSKTNDETFPNLAGMSRIRAQFDAEAIRETLLWSRIGISLSNSKSDLFPGSSARETSFSLDLMKPITDEYTVGAGAAFYSYADTDSFYDRALKNSRTNEQALLGATIQGLPQIGVSSHLTAAITDLDVFIPRYTATLIKSSRLWTHTLSMNWQHEFSKNWSLSPGYELSIEEGLTTSGFLMDLTVYF